MSKFYVPTPDNYGNIGYFAYRDEERHFPVIELEPSGGQYAWSMNVVAPEEIKTKWSGVSVDYFTEIDGPAGFYSLDQIIERFEANEREVPAGFLRRKEMRNETF